MKTTLETNMWLKCQLLVEGCSLSPSLVLPKNIHTKKIILYAHSQEKIPDGFPEDIIIGPTSQTPLICRTRYNSLSPFVIVNEEDDFFIHDTKEDFYHKIAFVSSPGFEDKVVHNEKVSDICQLLGTDLLGVVPSNYCFYFANNQQCRFCELVPTYTSFVPKTQMVKSVPLICDALRSGIESDARIQHLTVTTGNVKNYDYTFKYLVDIGMELKKNPPKREIQQSIAVVMPPDDVHLIDQMSESFFTKVYFPLEIFNKDFFPQTCPGKASFGYDKIVSSLEYSLQKFGIGNVYTNFVYGIQSLPFSNSPFVHDMETENIFALRAIKGMVARGILPLFTIYHYAGFNQIGKINLDAHKLFEFAKEWGEIVYHSGIIPRSSTPPLFTSLSLANTLFNEGYLLAHQNINPTIK